MAYVNRDPPVSLESVREPERDPGSRQDKRTELEMENPQEKFSAEGGGLATTEAARSDEAEEKHGNEKTKVGKGLESIGDMTADTLHRIATVVGGVAKAPVVAMAHVGGLASSANSPTSSQGSTPLLERVSHLEMQIAMLEEKYNSKTLATEFNLSPPSHPTTPGSTEKLRTARSLLYETETKGTLVERVQILEDRITEHMEGVERALSTIQSKLAHVATGELKPESLAVHDAHVLDESPPGEEFHDADQGSGTLEHVETLEQKSVAEASVSSDVLGEARRTTPTLQEALVEEPLAAAPSAEPAPEDNADKSTTVLPPSEPSLASSLQKPQIAFAKQPFAAAPSAELLESTLNAGEKSGIAVAEDSSIVEEPQETLVKEPLAAAPTEEPAGRVQGVDAAGNNGTVVSISEPQVTSILEEPQGALTKEPLIAEGSAKLEEPAAQTYAPVFAGAELPLTSRVEVPQNGTVGYVEQDKHVQKEFEHKAAEDVKVPAGKPAAYTSFVMEPKPHGHREKKKKGKKHEGVADEERKTSSRGDDKGKQTFKHLRERFKRAFKSNKDS